MSVSNTTSKAGPYSANGAQVVFPFGFKAFSKNDLRAVLTNPSAVESDLTVDSQFTVSLNADQNASPGGTITTIATYAAGYSVTIASNQTANQLVSITNFRPDVIEKAFDKLTLLVQQLFEQTSRSVKTSISSTTTPDALLTSIATSVSAAATSATASAASATDAAARATAANASAVAAAASAASIALPISVVNGGTGATTAETARAALSAAASGANSDITALSALTSINGGPLAGLRNKLINGGMDVWQRNTNYALTSTTAYGSADRWHCKQATAAAGVGQQSAAHVPSGFKYSFMLGRNSGSSSTNALQMGTCLESVNSIPLQGQTVTVSFYAQAGTTYSGGNLSLQIQTGTGTDQSSVAQAANTWTGYTETIYSTPITTAWTRYQKTVTLASNITQIGLMFNWTPSGTAGADDTVYITGVQLEIGSVATPFERRHYGLELALCQRYYFRIYPGAGGQFPAPCYIANTTTAQGVLIHKVPMRAAPTVLEQSGTITDYAVADAAGATVCATSAPALASSTPDCSTINFTTGATLTTGRGGILRAATANGYLGLNAEL